MTVEEFLFTIEGSLAIGFAAGLLVGYTVAKSERGCLILLAVPAAMIAYVAWWQSQHPEHLTSTSSLDLMFGALWPSVGAMAGYFAGTLLRWRFR